MLGWIAAVLSYQFLVHFSPFSALSSGLRFWRYKPFGLAVAGSWIPISTFAFG